MIRKTYISAQQLLDDSFSLGLKVLESGYRPSFIVGVWRGGAPIGIAIQELLDYFGIHTDHIAIRTSLYEGIDKKAGQVKVHGLGYVLKNITADDAFLIVDDVHDSGLSIQQIGADIEASCLEAMPEIRVAMPYYKPGNNQTGRVPDYYLHETGDWLVFPHELAGLAVTEILDQKPGIDALRKKLLTMS